MNDNTFAPDPDFAGMSIPEIWEILDEREQEDAFHREVGIFVIPLH